MNTVQNRIGFLWAGLLIGCCLLVAGVGPAAARPSDVAWSVQNESLTFAPTDSITYYVYLPLVHSAPPPCQPLPGASYGTLDVVGPPTDRPAEQHADLNLALRSYEPTTAFLGLVDVGGSTDANAPQLAGLFSDGRVPTFSAAYQVHDWYWGCNCQGPVITVPEVTLVGMSVTPGEHIHVPSSGYDIGGGYEVLVLYAATDRITLKYTGEDSVAVGYALHVENICVDPNLVALYEQWNAAGRGRLPALKAGQAFGYAQETDFGVAIRDSGAFMDPRSRKDWWK